MRKSIVMILAALPFLAVSAFAQGPNTTMTLLCKTSDGLVTISDQRIALADYNLQFDSMIREGVVRYRDAGTGVTATLDARGDEGLYIEILENGSTMLVVADRSDVRYSFDDNGSEPAAPSLTSVMPHNAVPAATESK